MFDLFTLRLVSPLRPLTFFMADAPKDPDFIEKYKKLAKKAKKLIDTLDIDHADVYMRTAEKHLRDSDGLIDYDMLAESENQEKFADALASAYQDKAKKVLKSGVTPADAFENELLSQAVYGTTREQIKQAVARFGKSYTAQKHAETAENELMQRIKQSLASVPGQHISDKNIDDILKYTKAEKSAGDFGYELKKDAVTREGAIQLLDVYNQVGVLGKNVVEGYRQLFKKKKK